MSSRNEAPLLRPANLTRRVYERLKEQIYDGTFSTEKAVYETHLAEKLGVSRTPVREAVRMLENEGLIEQLSGGGIRAYSITAQDIKDASDTRLAIELITTRLAAERITAQQGEELIQILERAVAAISNGLPGEAMKENEQFHRFIALCTGSRLLEQFVDRIYDYIKPQKLLMPLAKKENIQDIMLAINKEHREIAAAITSRNATLAARTMQKHLEGVSNRYQEILE